MAEKSKYADEYMTVQEVADLFHVSRKTVYAWSNSGKLKRYSVQGRTLFKSVDVRALIKEA